MMFSNLLPPEDLRKLKFACRVCGVQCAMADPLLGAVCEEHCEDHDYQYLKGEGGHFCIHCGKPRPEDWFDENDLAALRSQRQEGK
jgi:hypothetical protein